MPKNLTPFPYNYAVKDISEGDEIGYTAIIPKFPKIYVCADTPEELHSAVREEILEEVECYKQEGIPVPEPDNVPQKWSGKFVLRIPPKRHERLVELAQAAGCSLNRYVGRILEEKVGV